MPPLNLDRSALSRCYQGSTHTPMREPRLSKPRQDEFECLNANIYAPAVALSEDVVGSKKPLPVIAWMHGGAYIFGSNATEGEWNGLS